MRLTLHELVKVLKEIYLKKETSHRDLACSDSRAASMEGITENGLETLVRLLKEHYHDSFGNDNNKRLLPLEVSTNAFVPSAATPDLDKLVFGEYVVNHPEKNVHWQSVVASESFGPSKKRFNTITARAEEKDFRAGLGHLPSNRSIQTIVWCACAHSYTRLSVKSKASSSLVLKYICLTVKKMKAPVIRYVSLRGTT